MSTRHATAQAVAAIFTAAGRNYADVELALYHEALAGIDDTELGDTIRLIVRNVDFARRPPTPALVVDTALQLRAQRHLTQPAIPADTGPPVPPERALDHLAEIRRDLAARRATTTA